jgi:glucokinase
MHGTSDMTRTLLGLDIGGSKIACVEGTHDAQILQRLEMPTHGSRPFEQTLPLLLAQLNELMARSRAAGREIIAVSVSIGGPLRIAEGVLLDPPHLPGWHQVPLRERLRAALPGLPVYVEHDGNAGALAEFHFGVGLGRADIRHLIFLTFGTGLGAGFILNGRILHGASDSAGEIGHWRLAPRGPRGFGKAGSWEGFASGAALLRAARRRFPSRWGGQHSIRELIEAMLRDEPDALSVAHEAGRRMGHGLALLIDALNPQLIVLGSLAVALGERVLAPARLVVAREALPQAVAACAIVPAALGARIGDVAALMAGLSAPPVLAALRGES